MPGLPDCCCNGPLHATIAKLSRQKRELHARHVQPALVLCFAGPMMRAVSVFGQLQCWFTGDIQQSAARIGHVRKHHVVMQGGNLAGSVPRIPLVADAAEQQIR
jgi:hypothetical protein